MAWPERIVVIAFLTFVMFAGEVAALLWAKDNHAPGWFVVTFVVAAIFFDFWAVLRMIDVLFAGPARRRRDRIVKFSP